MPDPSGLGNFTATATDPQGNTSQLSPTLVIGQSPPVSSLSIVASTSPSSITAGQSSTVTYTITNQGPGVAVNVQAVLQAPAGVSGGNVTSITVGSTSFPDDFQPIAIGTLAAGQSRTLTLVYSQIYSILGTIIQTARVYGLYPDANAAMNSASATITVVPPPAPVITVTQAYSRPTVRGHAPITFTVTVANTGDADATGLSLVD